MVCCKERGGQPETETHSLGPPLQGCECCTQMLACTHEHTHAHYNIFSHDMYVQDIGFWMRDKQEVEIVDFLLQVKDTMVCTQKAVCNKGGGGRVVTMYVVCIVDTTALVFPHSLNPLPFCSLPPSIPSHPSSSPEPPSSTPLFPLKLFTFFSLRSDPSFPDFPRTSSHALNQLSMLHHDCVFCCVQTCGGVDHCMASSKSIATELKPVLSLTQNIY